jgi:hypothetical protein
MQQLHDTGLWIGGDSVQATSKDTFPALDPGGGTRRASGGCGPYVNFSFDSDRSKGDC